MAKRRSTPVVCDVVAVHTFVGTGAANGNAWRSMAWGEEWKCGGSRDLDHVRVLELPAIAVCTALPGRVPLVWRVRAGAGRCEDGVEVGGQGGGGGVEASSFE